MGVKVLFKEQVHGLFCNVFNYFTHILSKEHQSHHLLHISLLCLQSVSLLVFRKMAQHLWLLSSVFFPHILVILKAPGVFLLSYPLCTEYVCCGESHCHILRNYRWVRLYFLKLLLPHSVEKGAELVLP